MSQEIENLGKELFEMGANMYLLGKDALAIECLNLAAQAGNLSAKVIMKCAYIDATTTSNRPKVFSSEQIKNYPLKDYTLTDNEIKTLGDMKEQRTTEACRTIGLCDLYQILPSSSSGYFRLGLAVEEGRDTFTSEYLMRGWGENEWGWSNELCKHREPIMSGFSESSYSLGGRSKIDSLLRNAKQTKKDYLQPQEESLVTQAKNKIKELNHLPCMIALEQCCVQKDVPMELVQIFEKVTFEPKPNEIFTEKTENTIKQIISTPGWGQDVARYVNYSSQANLPASLSTVLQSTSQQAPTSSSSAQSDQQNTNKLG